MESVTIDENFDNYLLIHELEMKSSKYFASVLYQTWQHATKKFTCFHEYYLKKNFICYLVIRSRNDEFMVNNEFLSPWKSTLSWFRTSYSRLIRRESKTRSNRYGNMRDFHKTITPSFRCVYRSR